MDKVRKYELFLDLWESMSEPKRVGRYIVDAWCCYDIVIKSVDGKERYHVPTRYYKFGPTSLSKLLKDEIIPVLDYLILHLTARSKAHPARPRGGKRVL